MLASLATYRRIVARLSRHKNRRCDNVSRPCDGHECPSYRRAFRHSPGNLTHLQHVLKCHEAANSADILSSFAVYSRFKVRVQPQCETSLLRYNHSGISHACQSSAKHDLRHFQKMKSLFSLQSLTSAILLVTLPSLIGSPVLPFIITEFSVFCFDPRSGTAVLFASG